MNETQKLQVLRKMVRPELERLDARIESICRRRVTGRTAIAVADAFLEELGLATQLFVYDPDDRQFAVTTREFRELVRKALLPGVERRIAAYKKRFPDATAVFEQCKREALEILASVVHPGDMKMLASAQPGKYEACYWPEHEALRELTFKGEEDTGLSSFAVLRFSPPEM